MEGAEQVDGDHLGKQRGVVRPAIAVDGPRGRRDPGAGYDDARDAMRFLGAFQRGRDRPRVGDVGGAVEAVDLARDRRAARRIEIDDRHRRAAAGQRAGDRGAEPRGAAADDRGRIRAGAHQVRSGATAPLPPMQIALWTPLAQARAETMTTGPDMGFSRGMDGFASVTRELPSRRVGWVR